ncbi:hypothetical protein [Litoribacillus peritrichatus]|uniref:Core-binding (CB) domain-containing protein n=1 Tax=Litoribacillus peritrichatus TaxID=718191 RepID=A0ABP7MAS6_9GAMM
MNIQDQTRFNSLYQRYLNELTLQGKSPKTINMYSSCLRQVGDYFDCCPDQLTAEQGLLVCLAKHNASGGAKIRSIAIPSLCTGVGGMNETESAKQMKTAFENVVMDKWLSIKHPAMAPYATR